MSQVQPLLFLSKYNHFVSVNKSFYDKKTGATQTDPDLALRHIPLMDQLGKLPILRFLMLASISQSRCEMYAKQLDITVLLTCFVNHHLKY